MELTISRQARPNAPQWSVGLGAGMDRHHVLPYPWLRESFNQLLLQHVETEWPEARTALYQFLMLCREDWGELEGLLDRLRMENTTQRRTATAQRARLSVPELNEMQEAVAWPGWDLVEGPKNRTDGPAPLQPDWFRFGLTVEERGRMRALRALAPVLEQFAAAGARPGAGELSRFGQAMRWARRELGGLAAIRFRKEMWEEVRPGLWRKRTAE